MNLVEAETLLIAGLKPRSSKLERAQAISMIHKNNRIPPELALRIYRNNVYRARINTIAVSHSACFRILGEACFNSIARRFAEQTPSEQPDLNLYGAGFGDFLENWTTARRQFSDYPYLGDLARLEWLCHTAYYAADDSPFDFKALSEAGPEAQAGLCFQIGNSVGLLQSDYPVMAIREANLSAGDASQIQAVELPEFLVVSRPDYQPRVEPVDEMTFRILFACREGSALGHIVNANWCKADRINEVLPALIQRNWISGFTVASTAPRGSM